MTSTMALLVCGMGRIALGLVPFLAVEVGSRVLGFPGSHDNATSRLMSRLFGVRDAGLGVLALYAIPHPEVLVPVVLFNAAMDGGDLMSAAIPIVRRAGIDRGAVRTGLCALVGGLCWIGVWAVWG